jgi:hypothetical protein
LEKYWDKVYAMEKNEIVYDKDESDKVYDKDASLHKTLN